MIPTVDEVLQLAATLLGDQPQRKFNNPALQPFFELAFEELTGELARHHLPKQKREVLYTLPASTTTLTPATALISNFGELLRMEERPVGSGDRYTKVERVDVLPIRPMDSKLLEFEWLNDAWKFVGASQNLELRIAYFDSGAAPASGSSVGIDGSKNFLAHRTAALAALPAGNDQLAVEYDRAARGPGRDGGGGFLHTLLQAMVTAEQQVRMQAPHFEAGRAPFTFYGPV